jgi:hypothetical protein
MKRYLAIALMLFASASATAATGWTGLRTILGLEIVPTGIEIRLDGFGGACASVNENGIQKTWVKIETNQPNEKQYVVTVLMAFALGKRIAVYCPSDAAYPTLSNIVIQRE